MFTLQIEPVSPFNAKRMYYYWATNLWCLSFWGYYYSDKKKKGPIWVEMEKQSCDSRFPSAVIGASVPFFHESDHH